MADQVTFKYTADGKQFDISISNSLKKTEQLNFTINNTSKVAKQAQDALSKAQTGFQKTTKSATKNTPTEGGFLGLIKRISIAVRAMHLHGIDPATNKFARFFSVIGGAGITTVTFFATAVMAAYYALKKVNDLLQNYYKGLIAGFNNAIKISKGRLQDLKQEREGIKAIADQLDKITQKQKMGNMQQAYADILANRLVNTWKKLGGQVDKAVESIKAFRQIQASAEYENIEKQSAEIRSSMKARANKLNVMFTQYVGDNNIWSNPFRVDYSGRFKVKTPFTGEEFKDMSPLKMFPGWTHKWKSLEEVAKLDMSKLFFGNFDDKIEFFRQVSNNLTDSELQDQIGAMIDELQELKQEQKQLDKLNDPLLKVKKYFDKLDESVNQLGKDVDKFAKSIVNLHDRSQKFKLQNSSDEDQLKYWKNKRDQYKKIVEQSDANLDKALNGIDYGRIKYNEETGSYTTDKLQELKKRGKGIDQYYQNYLNAEKAHEAEYQQIINDYKAYKQAQVEIKSLKSQISNTPYRVGRLTDSQTQRLNNLKTQKEAAQKVVRTFESSIDQRWATYNANVAATAEKNRKQANASVNNPNLEKEVQDEINAIANAKRGLVQATTIIDQTTEAMNGLQEALSNIQRITEKLTNEGVKQVEEWIAELTEAVREDVAKQKEAQKKKDYLTGLGNNIIAKYMEDTGQGQSLRRQQIQREMKQQLGVKELTKNQKSIAARAAYIEMLQKQGAPDQNNTFKYGVKTNSLAARGGWNSSVYVSGKDNLMQQQLKTNQNQVKIAHQTKILVGQLKTELNAIDKSLKIQ